MRNKSPLNLLVIDDDQLYAERIVTLLSAYYEEVNLGFLDDEEELLKSLRHPWDVLVFGQSYDLSFIDVVDIVQEQGLDLPIIALMSNDMAATGRNEDGLPAVINSTIVKALLAEQETQVVISICLQHAGLCSRRQLKSLQQILSEAEQRANILIKNSKSAVAYLDQGIHIFANDPYLELFGFKTIDDVIGIPVIDLIAGGDNIRGFKQFLRQFDKGNREQVEFKFESRRLDGTTFEAKLQLAIATFESEPVTQIIIQQNTNNNSAEMERKLAAAERHDSLTNLTNRRGFEESFEALYTAVMQNKVSAGLLYIQLDNIGKISSSLGLQGVDATIKQVGYVLSEMITDGQVSRFSDTSFAILIESSSTKVLSDLAERIRASISNMLIEVDKRTTSTTASIGVVKIELNAAEPKVLLERAIEAINDIRINTNNHGNAYHLYDPREHANSDDDALAESLTNAVAQNRFELLFQPIYDVSADRSDFFEVYLRLPLSDANKTILTPEQFMSVAKTHNLHEKIDRWVLINACKQLNSVRKNHPEASVLVQLTGASLTDKKLSMVASQLINAVGGAANILTLQFNEQDIANHLTLAKWQFTQLRDVGCQVGINNFGSSAKSVEIADFVQPDIIRLARNYVDDINDADNLATVKSIIARATEHGVEVLMPYIEDAATMSVAWSVGAHYLQGKYLEEPSATMHIAT